MFVFAALIRGHYNESSDCFVYPQKSLLKSGHTKKHLLNFPTQKKSWDRKFQTQNNPWIIPITWNPAYNPTPPPLVVSTVEGEWDGNSELLDH